MFSVEGIVKIDKSFDKFYKIISKQDFPDKEGLANSMLLRAIHSAY